MEDRLAELKMDELGRVGSCEVIYLTGWSRWTLWRNIKAGRFPRPLSSHGSGRGVTRRWRASDIVDWAEAQLR